MMAAIRDTRADIARPMALELVGAVRDFDPDRVAGILDLADLPALAVVLAAMVDDGRTETELLGWMDPDRLPPRHLPTGVRPCGTHAAYARHKNRRETPCEACVMAERKYQRERPGRRAGDRARGAA